MNDSRHLGAQPSHPPGHQHRPMPVSALPGARPGIAPMPVQPIRQNESDLDPIELVDDVLEEVTSPAAIAPAPPKSKIIAFGQEMQRRHHEWKRTPHVSGQGAIRVKSFHGKYSDQGIEHLDDMINEWLDAHPEAEVKFVTSTVHVFEGKIREPALVLNVWY